MIGIMITKARANNEDVEITDQISKWTVDSHLWDEVEMEGYYICRWCGKKRNTLGGITFTNFPLCKDNPRLKGFVGTDAGANIINAIKEA